MTTPFVQNAARRWNSSDALERAFFAGETRRWFQGMEFDVCETVCKSFYELDNLTAMRLAEYFWMSRGSR